MSFDSIVDKFFSADSGQPERKKSYVIFEFVSLPPLLS